jgi:hypothetical protein
MKTFQINGKPFEFNEELQCLDFFLTDRKPNLVEVKWALLLEKLQDGSFQWDEATQTFVHDMSRWVHEAPRKRFYRNMKRDGMVVICTEYFFEEDGGDKIIDGLENCGVVAAALCRHYGVEPMAPIKHDDPFNPVQR